MSIRVAATREWVSNTMASHRFWLGEWWYAQRIVGFDAIVEVFAAPECRAPWWSAGQVRSTDHTTTDP